MGKFKYVMTDENGKRIEGEISASNQESATKKLRKKGKIIVSVLEEKSAKGFFVGKPKLSMEEKMMFTKNLATMIKVGVTITECFEILIKQAKSERIKMMYRDMLDMISSGQTLAKCLKKYDSVFSTLYVNMVETAEESGKLVEVLEYLDVQLEKDYDLRKKITSAFIYPGLIISVTIIMAIGIVIFIMPKITDIFKSFDMDLPLPTRILIGMSNFVINYTLIASLSAIAFIAVILTLPKIKFVRKLWHRVSLRIPVFGKLIVYGNVARFGRTLNSLLQSGVPITKALKIITKMLDNTVYKKAVKEAADKVEQGGKLGECFEDQERLFPILASRMLDIGERTGSLEVTTERIAELYEKNVDSITKNLSVLMEPILLVFMAALVGGIALSIVMPIYQLPNLLSS